MKAPQLHNPPVVSSKVNAPNLRAEVMDLDREHDPSRIKDVNDLSQNFRGEPKKTVLQGVRPNIPSKL